jgi:hypothetical protein
MSRSIPKKFTNVFSGHLIGNSKGLDLSQDFYLKHIYYHRRLPLWDTESNMLPNMDHFHIFLGKELLNIGGELELGLHAPVSPCCWGSRASKPV